MGFKIGERHVGDGAPCLIIAEVGLAHEGSVTLAHSYIDAVAKAGADVVKFQCHLGDPVKEWRVEPSWPQDKDRQAYWRRTSFSEHQWWDLRAHALAENLIFLCSPFSVQAVAMLNPMVEAWKVPSGKIMDKPMLVEIAATAKPVILSAGMRAELAFDWACKLLKPDAVLNCTSLYPCPPEMIDLYREGFDGLSDHSGTVYAGLGAAALGAVILEFHVCFSKQQGGFDTSSSITMAQLGELVEGVRFLEKAKKPVDRQQMNRTIEPMRRVFMYA